jgi:hypothetical protein
MTDRCRTAPEGSLGRSRRWRITRERQGYWLGTLQASATAIEGCTTRTHAVHEHMTGAHSPTGPRPASELCSPRRTVHQSLRRFKPQYLWPPLIGHAFVPFRRQASSCRLTAPLDLLHRSPPSRRIAIALRELLRAAAQSRPSARRSRTASSPPPRTGRALLLGLVQMPCSQA